MSTITMPAAAVDATVEVHSIALDDIDIVHNARTVFDADSLQQLADSLTERGQLQPVSVVPAETPGRWRLVAGERRYRASHLAGRPRIDAIVRPASEEASLRLDALAENMEREELSPVEEAREFRALMDLGGLTEEGIAAKVKRSTDWVRGRLSLLALPETVQQDVHDGKVTLKAADALASIANVDPNLAAAVGKRVSDGRVSSGELVADVAAQVAAVAYRPDDEDPDVQDFTESLTVADLHAVHRDALGDLDLSPNAEMVAKVAKAPCVRAYVITEADVDQARAAGVLLSFRRDRYTTTNFVTDKTWLADWSLQRIEQLKEQALKQLAEAAEAATSAGGEDAEARAAADRRAAAQREREERAKARGANVSLGANLLRELAEPKLTKDRALLLAGIVLGRDTDQLIARGVRYTHEQFMQRVDEGVEHDDTEVGEGAGELDYLQGPELTRRALEWVSAGRNGQAVLGRLLQLIGAALFADQVAVKPGQRTHVAVIPHTRGREGTCVAQVRERAWGEFEALLPERIHAATKAEFTVDATAAVEERIARPEFADE